LAEFQPKPIHTVVVSVVSVLGTLIITSPAGIGSNPTIDIRSSIVAVNFYNIECSINVHQLKEDPLRKILQDPCQPSV
jgi:hypothetical protein